jgi:uncharacterized membrane protein YedE/YeeE
MTTLWTMVRQPWPWYVAGPLIGLMVPALLLAGNKSFGISSNLRHMCAIAAPRRTEYLRYDWRKAGGWNLAFAAGIALGGLLAVRFLTANDHVAISDSTRASLAALGIHEFRGLAPRELFSWSAVTTIRGLMMVLGGGLLVGFGTAYAGGCTSGHAISGLANLQLPSLIAVLGFFAGGLASAWLILPAVLVR